MLKYYQVVVKIKFQDDKGKIKTKTERYLVDSLTVTEAEARAVEFMKDYPEDFVISSVTESRIVQLITPLQTPEIYG